VPRPPWAKCHLKVQFRSNLYAENRNISFKEHWTFGKKKRAMDRISLVLQNPWEVAFLSANVGLDAPSAAAQAAILQNPVFI